jgi:type IV pilus assembly protein PilA
MKTMQKGFTLIELMIVVAIIGILAAIAVPAYQDYTIKSKVSEAASMATAPRTAVDIAFSEGFNLGAIPAQSALGLPLSTSFVSKYVNGVSVDADGVVTVTMQGTTSTITGTPLTGLPSTGTIVAGGTVIFTPRVEVAGGGNLTWSTTCGWGTKYCPKN